MCGRDLKALVDVARVRYASPFGRFALLGGIAGIAIALGLVLLLDVPIYPAWIVGLSIVTFTMYGFDKRQSVRRGGRVPELVLHGLALGGGFPGGWAGRMAFRHKTRQAVFLIVLLCATTAHAAIVWSIGV